MEKSALGLLWRRLRSERNQLRDQLHLSYDLRLKVTVRDLDLIQAEHNYVQCAANCWFLLQREEIVRLSSKQHDSTPNVVIAYDVR